MYSIINSLPKAEHHIHLVGSIRPETLLWVADESGLDNQWDSVEEVRAFFKFSDFPHFLKVFGTCMAYITKESMFERIAYETLEDQAGQNARARGSPGLSPGPRILPRERSGLRTFSRSQSYINPKDA
jgi:aminodeoxyfutalosine deaminase